MPKHTHKCRLVIGVKVDPGYDNSCSYFVFWEAGRIIGKHRLPIKRYDLNSSSFNTMITSDYYPNNYHPSPSLEGKSYRGEITIFDLDINVARKIAKELEKSLKPLEKMKDGKNTRIDIEVLLLQEK